MNMGEAIRDLYNAKLGAPRRLGRAPTGKKFPGPRSMTAYGTKG